MNSQKDSSTFDSSIKNSYIIYLFYTIIICIFYSPIIWQSYALTDDYEFLYVSIEHSPGLLHWDTLNGRPLYGILQYIFQHGVNSIHDLSLVRGFSVLITILFSIFIHRFLSYKVELASPLLVLCLPLFLAFIPPIVVYNAWVTCAFFMLALLLSGYAYNCLFNYDRKTSVVRFIAGTILLILAFLIYQPAGMAFLYFVFVCNCLDNRKLYFKNLIFSALSLMIAMFCSLLAVKVVPKIIFGEVIPRSQFNHDFIAKMHWFISEVLVNAISNYNIIPNVFYTIISGIIFIIGLFFIAKKTTGYQKVGVTVLCMVGTIFPSLVAKESWAAFRILAGLDLIVVTVIFYAIIEIFHFFKMTNYIKTVLLCLFSCMIFYMQYCMYKGFIYEQQSEYQALTQEVVTKIPKEYNGKIRFDLSSPVQKAFTRLRRYDEFGAVSMQVEWAVKGMAASIKKNKGLNYQIDSNLVLQPNEVCKDNCIIIDTSKLLKKASIY